LTATVCFYCLPNLSWRKPKYREHAVIITLNNPKNKRVIKDTPLVHIWWPFQQCRIYSTLPYITEPISVRLPTKDLEIAVNGFQFEIQIFGADLAWDAPKHDPEEAAYRIALNFLTGVTAKYVIDEIPSRIEEICNLTRDHLDEQIRKWGATINRVYLNDIDWPQAYLDAQASRKETDAAAYDIEKRSVAEVDAYNREKTAQGPDYMRKQALDAQIETARAAATGKAAVILNIGGSGDDDEVEKVIDVAHISQGDE